MCDRCGTTCAGGLCLGCEIELATKSQATVEQAIAELDQ